MIKGSLPALVTPFKNGELDLDTLEKLVEWQIAEGSNGLVPVGTTGESPTLSHEEHDLVVATVIRVAKGRVPVVAGSGSNNTIEAVRLVTAAKNAGADAALVVTPYYNKPTQRGMLDYFTAVGAVGLPVIIYNIPARSVVDLQPATMGELAKHPMMIGVKDATGDLSRVAKQRLSCGADFVQLSGEDATAVGFNAMGGVGCISVTANVAPRLCAEFQAATLAGDYKLALDYQDRLMPLHKAIFMEPGVCGTKYALSKTRGGNRKVRSPLMDGLEPATEAAIDAALIHAGLIN